MRFPTTPLLDDFTRGNQTGLGDSRWSTDYDAGGRDSHDISSNTAKAPAGGFGSNWWNVQTFGPDCEVWATVAAMPTNQALRLNLRLNGQGTAGANGYQLSVGTDGIFFLLRIDGGNFGTQVNLEQGLPGDIQAGDIVGLQAVGNYFMPYRIRSAGPEQLLPEGGWVFDDTYQAAGHIHMMTQNETVAAFGDFGGGTIHAPGYQRLVGPHELRQDLSDTLYVVPAGHRARIRHISANNPSGSPVDFTLSVGADAASTRLYDSYNIPAGESLEWAYDHALAAGERIQAYAGTASTLILTIDGFVEAI